MAIQMGVAVGLSYGLGRWWFPEHWTWMVLSAYVVGAGTRGRMDVLHKGLLRVVGALAGTVAATLIANAVSPGNRWDVVMLFAVMALSMALRPVSYALWAGGVTAMLALLNGYYGASGAQLLVERLGAVALGSFFAIAVAWFVLPVRAKRTSGLTF